MAAMVVINMNINTKQTSKHPIEGIPLILGLGTKMSDPNVYVVLFGVSNSRVPGKGAVRAPETPELEDSIAQDKGDPRNHGL